MSEFLNNEQENITEEIEENEINSEISETVEEETQNFDEPISSEPVYTPINYSTPIPVADYRPMSKGLKVFSLILAIIVALTGSCLAGYFIGKNGNGTVKSGKKPSVNLAAKPADTDELTAAEVYEKVDRSVVGIMIYNMAGEMSQASGIVFSKDGYIVTNDHIYSEIASAKFKIYTFDGKEYDAKFVAGDQISDLAVLKIDSGEFSPAEFANSDDLYYGQNVVAIGRPSDAIDPSSITDGVISAVNRRVSTTSNYSSRLIQTSCPINPGSSGGALVNMYGQVVGVTSSKLVSDAYDNVGYAIPTTVMKRIVDELIGSGKVVSRAKLGITYSMIDSVTAEIKNQQSVGLKIASVSEDSGLYGKVEENDIITHIND
ncbi:MAG: trypsin-like peptidase domain-containing protein, partial [Clostridia bacterium]|nr:trypsin-like peptidase domain-containing protein [Clostridia bacterium]